jgi:DNA (cytosine-5)-methyltransferase 1
MPHHFAYYNENDPQTAAWLRELIRAGHVMDGIVDDRSITEVAPEDVQDFTQCHFFAGIGGWSYALRLAGWPDDRPVWTGSCPCQSFSAAGKQKGFEDLRHLWPYWASLILQCRPPVVFGEQVEAAIRHGWLDTVFGDLEAEGYACGASVLGAHSVGGTAYPAARVVRGRVPMRFRRIAAAYSRIPRRQWSGGRRVTC